VVVFLWWCEASDDPIEQIGIGTVEQSFQPVELGVVEISEMGLGKSADYETALLSSAMPAPE